LGKPLLITYSDAGFWKKLQADSCSFRPTQGPQRGSWWEDSYPILFARTLLPHWHPSPNWLATRATRTDDGGVKRWYYIVLGGILLAGAGYIWLNRVELGLASPPADNAETTYSAGSSATPSASSSRPARIFWQKVDRSSDGFKVEMPADVKDMQTTSYNSQGGTEPVNMIYAYPDAQTSFSVAWADNPPVARANSMAVDKTLDTAMADAMARTQTSLVAQSKANRKGYPARDFAARNAHGGIYNTRLLLVGQRLYMLIAAFPDDSARKPNDVARFFDSFTPVRSGS